MPAIPRLPGGRIAAATTIVMATNAGGEPPVQAAGEGQGRATGGGPPRDPNQAPTDPPGARPASAVAAEPESALLERARVQIQITNRPEGGELPARDVLRAYQPGSGFPGTYNPPTDSWMCAPEALADTASHGRHVEPTLTTRMNARVRSGNVGFTLIWRGNDQVALRWNSQMNEGNFGTRAAPLEVRANVVRSIEESTGFTVVEEPVEQP